MGGVEGSPETRWIGEGSESAIALVGESDYGGTGAREPVSTGFPRAVRAGSQPCTEVRRRPHGEKSRGNGGRARDAANGGERGQEGGPGGAQRRSQRRSATSRGGLRLADSESWLSLIQRVTFQPDTLGNCGYDRKD